MSKIEHVAIIMDGNGRWAEGRRRPRVWGHVRGANRINDIVEEAQDCKVKALTLFAFSTENWSRPQREILTLFNLLKKFLSRERAKIIKNQIRFRVIGNIRELPQKTKEMVLELEETTKDHPGLRLNFAFDYGGRSEILDSVNQFIHNHPGVAMTEKDLQDNLYLPEVGDVDLLIRTGGEYRISNFLLWQMAYAELHFTQTKWPDFTRGEFRSIYLNASSRERRFGGVEADCDLSSNIKAAHLRKVVMRCKVDNIHV